MSSTRSRPAPILLRIGAGVVALLASLPLFWVVVRGLGTGDVWRQLWASGRLQSIVSTSLVLAVVVGMGSASIGTVLAWLSTRTDLPGGGALAVLGVIPLGLPPFLVAASLLALAGPGGALTPQGRFLPVFGIPGSALVLTVVCVPFTLLLARAAFARADPSLEEAAESLGASRLAILVKVAIPIAASAAFAGGLISGLYALADFGVVSLLRTDTFSAAIYTQLTTRFSAAGASALSLLLVAVALGILFLHGVVVKRSPRVEQSSGAALRRVPLGRARVPVACAAWAYCIVVVAVPVGVLFYWTTKSIGGDLRLAYWRQLWNSLWPSVLASTLAIVLCIPVARLITRHSGFYTSVTSKLTQVGDALPGVVIGLALVSIFNRYLPVLYGTVGVVVIAYVLLYMTRAVQGDVSALLAAPPDVEDAAIALSPERGRALFRVTIPLAWPGLVATWLIVFLSTIRELPATLLLRPPGFETLATGIWVQTSEGYYELAAVPALTLVGISLVATALLLRRSAESISLPKRVGRTGASVPASEPIAEVIVGGVPRPKP